MFVNIFSLPDRSDEADTDRRSWRLDKTWNAVVTCTTTRLSCEDACRRAKQRGAFVGAAAQEIFDVYCISKVPDNMRVKPLKVAEIFGGRTQPYTVAINCGIIALTIDRVTLIACLSN